MSVLITPKLECVLSGSTFMDISAHVSRSEPVQCGYGITGIGPLDLTAATGNLSFALNNSEGTVLEVLPDAATELLTNGGFETAGADNLSDTFTRADGAPGVAESGQTWVRVPAGDVANVVEATISSNALIAADSGGAVTSAYTGVDLGATHLPNRMRATIVFSTGTLGGNVVLISNPNGLAHVSEITAGSVHINFSDYYCKIGYFASGTLYPVGQYDYPVPDRCLRDNTTPYSIGWSISGDVISVEMPNGTVQQYTSAALVAKLGRYCTFEHYHYATGATRARFLDVTTRHSLFGTWSDEPYDGAIADEETLVHGGSHAVKLTAGPSVSTNTGDYSSFWDLVTANTTYRISFWTRGDGTNAGRVGIYDVSNSAWITVGSGTTGVVGTTYAEASVTFTTPAGCTKIRAYLFCPAVNGGIAYFDDVSVKAISTRPAGYYTPGHVDACSGWDLGTKARLSYSYSGSTFYKMVGYVTDIAPTAGIYKDRRADVSAVDWWDFAATQKVRQLEIQSNITTGCALQTLLAQTVIQPRATCIMTSQETYERVFDSDNDAKTTIAAGIAKLMRNELGQAYLRGDSAGGETLEMMGRYGRIAGGAVAMASLNSTMTELEIEYDRSNIWNVVRGRTYPKSIDTAACTCVFTLQNPISIGASESQIFTAHYRDVYSAKPISASAIVYPFRAGVDYNFGSASGTGIDDKNTSACFSASLGSNSARVEVENNSATAGFLNDFKLYGKGIYYFDPVEYEARDSDSASAYGERVLDLELEYQTNETRGEPLAQYLMGIWKGPRRLVKSVRFLANKSAAAAEAAMLCEPGSRVYISEPMTATDGYYDINSVKYETVSAQETWVTWGVVTADTTEYFRLDHSLLDVDALAP